MAGSIWTQIRDVGRVRLNLSKICVIALLWNLASVYFHSGITTQSEQTNIAKNGTELELNMFVIVVQFIIIQRLHIRFSI